MIESSRRTTYANVLAAARIMEGFPGPWLISGGWSIDLFAGQVTREHEDLEIGICRSDQWKLRDHLSGWTLEKAVDAPNGGGMWVPWEPNEWLELPIFQIKAERAALALPEFEFMLNESIGDGWLFRRKPEITLPMSVICRRSCEGIPHLAPEWQLLYKAKWHRRKDEHDFQTALPLLDEAQRSWLKNALQSWDSRDPWIGKI